jgi:glycogen debranching enzyme
MIQATDQQNISGGEHEPDPYYIAAAAPSADELSRVLKHADTFVVFDHHGDIRPTGLHEQGLYHDGTRFLSCQLVSLNRARPLFLSSTIREDNDLLVVDLTNPDFVREGEIAVPRGTLHILRIKFLWQGVCYERMRVKNYGLTPVDVSIGLHFEADFVDIFEVRGMKRERRGDRLSAIVEDESVTLAYRGLDDLVRRTQITFRPRPDKLTATDARFQLSLDPNQEAVFEVTTACEIGETVKLLSFDAAVAAAEDSLRSARPSACAIRSSKQHFNDWINRTVADLHMMITQTSEGPYPFAGVPWFSTPFGRDGIITALECLWVDPPLAKGVLGYLAATQSHTTNAEEDAEPGKILHETRLGEMAALGEIPFGRYYGSVDATPLFVLLAGAYFERTADHEFVQSIWPNIEAALRWIDQSGDADGDGFVEYNRRSATGLANQGWKDSHDAIFHADGTMAEGPIALCEVQAYVYGAKQAAANIANALGLSQQSERLQREADALREQFETAFWCEDLGTYALALDGQKRPCRVRTSNAGHCLLTGICSSERAHRVAQTLLDAKSFSGWGVRTVAVGEARYNPMSYHNGSVWPHDNALIAAGLARYWLKDEVLQIMAALFDSSLFIDLHRLPELYCGFVRRPGEGPTLYPVACSPQSWSAASVFLLLQACLGLTIHAAENRLSFTHPVLPAFLNRLELHNLRVGQGRVDLLLLRHGQDVGINVLRREGQIEIAMVK